MISFFVIGTIWVNHHALFVLIEHVDRAMLFYNLLLLFLGEHDPVHDIGPWPTS